jgi:hypothetical protein
VLQEVRVEQLPAFLREDHTSLVVAKVDDLDEPLVAEMVECVVADVEIVLGHDTNGADDSQCSVVLAVQFVDTVTIKDQLALLAARDVEVAHQTVARVVIVPVALVVHARTPIIAFAEVVSSGVVHETLPRADCCCANVREGSRAENCAGRFNVAVEGRIGDRSAQGVVVMGIQVRGS